MDPLAWVFLILTVILILIFGPIIYSDYQKKTTHKPVHLKQ